MANRGLTIAEMKAMLDDLADKVTEEGADLYQDISENLDRMADASAAKADELARELGPKLEALKSKVTEEGKEAIEFMQSRMDLLMAEIQGEIAEFREVGFVAWVQSNPATAVGLGLIVLFIIGAVVKLLS